MIAVHFCRSLLGVASMCLALAACSPEAKTAPGSGAGGAVDVRAEFLKAEQSGTAMGDLFLALRESQPDVYEKFIQIASDEIAKGKTPFEAGAAARPLYLERFLETMRTTSDENVNELLAFSQEQMKHALSVDPQLCVKLTNGEADPRTQKFPPELIQRELELMAKVLRDGDRKTAGASADEIETWTLSYLNKNPDAAEGLSLIGTASPDNDQARQICQANIDLLGGMLAEPPQQRAYLFRGALALS
jgi:hypothetical protein